MTERAAVSRLCARCGGPIVGQLQRGRPRKYCLGCSPSAWARMTPEQRRVYVRNVRNVRRARRSRDRRALAGRLSLLMHLLILEKLAAADEMDPRTGICGCGRDYLTVPLEESYECPSPGHRRILAA